MCRRGQSHPFMTAGRRRSPRGTVPADEVPLPGDTGRRSCGGGGGRRLPDADLLWSMSTVTGDRLGYLLEHRGHTHTMLGCVLLAALLYVGTLGWLRFRALRPGSRDLLTLAFMALLAVFLHLGMDALNSYGGHPFGREHDGSMVMPCHHRAVVGWRRHAVFRRRRGPGCARSACSSPPPRWC